MDRLKFLIVRTSALGDIVHTYPVIEYLKHRFPDAQIDWVVEVGCGTLVERHPHITRTLFVHTKMWRKHPFTAPTRNAISAFKQQLREVEYDAVFDLQGNIKSALITFFARSKHKVGFGYQTVSEIPNLLATHHRYNPPKGQNIREDYLSIVKQHFNDSADFHFNGVVLNTLPAELDQLNALLAPFNNRFKLIVCTGSNWKNKRLPLESVIGLLQNMPKGHFFLLCWATAKERISSERLHHEFPDRSIILPLLPLHLLQNLMSRVDLVFSMDSLPLHLAGTTNTATISFFGPSLAEKYRPLGDQHTALQRACPYGVAFDKRCPKLRTCTTGACLRSRSFQ